MGFLDNMIDKYEQCLNDFLAANSALTQNKILRTVPNCPQGQPMLPPEAASLPHQTVLVLDKSGSMDFSDYYPKRIKAAKEASMKYIQKRSQLSKKDLLAIVGFDVFSRVYLPWNSLEDQDNISRALRKIKAVGGTDLHSGLKAAKDLFEKIKGFGFFRRILLITDGQGGDPVTIAHYLKMHGILIQVIGIAGSSSEVNEPILRASATTDQTGFNHYWFIEDSQSLIELYEQLSTSIVIGRK